MIAISHVNKKKWRRDIEQFFRDIGSDKPGGGTVAMYVFRNNTALAGMLANDPVAVRALQCIGQWLVAASRASPGKGPLCLSCNTEFSRTQMPKDFLMIVPYMKEWSTEKTTALVTGICTSCSKRSDDDLLAVARAMWLRSNPGSHELPPEGHA